MLTPREVILSVKAFDEREKRADYRAGVIGAVILNVNRDPKRRPQPFQPKDLFGSLRPPRRVQTPQQQQQFLISLAKRSGADVVYRPKESFSGA